MGNPFVITFGTTPPQYIPRLSQREHIIQDYNSSIPSTRAYAIIGVRGSGKTVLLSEIAEKIGQEWICIDLNIQSDLMRSLASQLYAEKGLHKDFIKAGFDFSFMGLGVHIDSNLPAYDDQTAINMMLEEVSKRNKKVLVTIDETCNNESMRRFAGAFQIFIRNNLPIYLVMAGIPENIYGLFDDKMSTFLYRTPRIEMTPLSLEMIRRSYMRTLNVDDQTAVYLAELTAGYPFGYQVLGYLCWGKAIDVSSDSFSEIIEQYDYYLRELSYIKIWSEMSQLDRRLVRAIASGNHTAADIQKEAGMNSKKYSVYRNRLKRKGILDTHVYGELRFALPRFAEFAESKDAN